jgi:hypothetical protein
MTKAAHEGKSLDCQGLHNAEVLAYVSFEHGASDRRPSLVMTGFSYVLPPRREDECIGC